jgi:uncharacterized protein YuzE
MKMSYYNETDSLYIELSSEPSVDSIEVSAGVVADFDKSGKIVGIDIDNASKTTELSHLQFAGIGNFDISRL